MDHSSQFMKVKLFFLSVLSRTFFCLSSGVCNIIIQFTGSAFNIILSAIRRSLLLPGSMLLASNGRVNPGHLVRYSLRRLNCGNINILKDFINNILMFTDILMWYSIANACVYKGNSQIYWNDLLVSRNKFNIEYFNIQYCRSISLLIFFPVLFPQIIWGRLWVKLRCFMWSYCTLTTTQVLPKFCRETRTW